MVAKVDGSWQSCGDFRHLNNIPVQDCYSIPHIQNFSVCRAGTTIVCKVDLVCGYHQVPVHREDGLKATVITLLRLFEFFRMPFGLKGATMDSVLRDLPFVFVYLDDILVPHSISQWASGPP